MDKDKQVITVEQLSELDTILQTYIPGEYILCFPMIEGNRIVTRMEREKIPAYLREVADNIQADSFHELKEVKKQ